jgi:hypothetical protein
MRFTCIGNLLPAAAITAESTFRGAAFWLKLESAEGPAPAGAPSAGIPVVVMHARGAANAGRTLRGPDRLSPARRFIGIAAGDTLGV